MLLFAYTTTRERFVILSDISKLSQISYNNFEISLVVFMPNITTNNAITYITYTNIILLLVNRCG